MTLHGLRSLLWLPLCGLLGCADGQGADSAGNPGLGGSASATTSTSGGNDGSTSSDPSADASTSSQTSSTPSTDETGEPPIECDPGLSACGQACVDLQSDPTNCGDCGLTCVVPNGVASCDAGACVFDGCERGWGDCDGDLANGCEEVSECTEAQSCQTRCGSTGMTTCEGCTATCLAPAETCNAVDDDCNGSCDEGPLPGCRQPVHRSHSPTLGHFYTLDLAEASSGDYSLESQDYYYTVAEQAPDLSALHRCLRPNGKRFYTLSANCEGAGNAEGILGYIAPDDRCGSTELYRLYHPGNNAHFYTISAGERDNAVSNGWTFESVVGFVWQQP